MLPTFCSDGTSLWTIVSIKKENNLVFKSKNESTTHVYNNNNSIHSLFNKSGIKNYFTSVFNIHYSLLLCRKYILFQEPEKNTSMGLSAKHDKFFNLAHFILYYSITGHHIKSDLCCQKTVY